jgi:predicted nucleic acid-binding protein
MLLDTSGLLCLVSLDEPHHRSATQLYKEASNRVIHNYVLDEFVSLAHARKLNREVSLAYSASWFVSPKVEIIWVDERLHRAALSLLQARLDKTYSLCDAVSFVIMRERA